MATFTNQAQLAYNNTVINSNVAVGEVVGELTVTKTAIGDTYGRSDNVSYAISITNSSAAPLNNVTVTDNLGAYTVGTETYYPLSYVDGTARLFVNGVPTGGLVVTPGTPIEFSGITIPVGGNAIIIYETSVTEFAPLDVDGSITNTVTVNTEQASETITTEQAPDLAITKNIEPIPVTQNSEVTYTFTILNYGNTAATVADNAALTDTFDPILTNLTVAFNGTAWTEGVNYSYDETTGLFTTVAGQITVPAATYTVDPVTNATIINPGVSELVVTGTI
ncbi:MAG: hypothetical protein IKY44_00590 [Clostridia bacterium]|nr:hypothetical protein [Clostridia bacterium]